MLCDDLIGKIIQCHIDHSDPDTFVVGRLVYMDKIWFLMQDISPVGRWNGIALYTQADLVSVEQDTDYIHRIEVLLKHRNEAEPMIPPITKNLLISLLSYAKESMKIIGLELYASGYRDINGIVDNLSNQTLCIRQIDEFGKPDGKSYLSIHAITRCFMEDEESKCLEVLAK